MSDHKQKFMQIAIDLSREGMQAGHGGPFGSIVVKEGEIIGKGYNKVLSEHDPTAHAEIIAIREACQNLKSNQLEGCEIYSSCEPWPMCLGAIYWARPGKVYFANNRSDDEKAGFDDSFIYKEIALSADKRKIPMFEIPGTNALKVFREWEEKEDKTTY